nr:uncharacterized protein LOC116430086 [Nomia melanderi]XP_031839616.1 uncharacterized protein LOC116430086 [Nomia melanderi]XP_031839617.1 uncharacterized protein LOC116430086 [Nomia melanderi]XP_031839618.1 uncharacterized protein LOC116430086 [Nomia melanderi]
MKTPSVGSLSAIVFLSFFVSPLQSDPQQIYWSNYPVHRPLDPQSQSTEEFLDQLGAASVQGPYVPRYVPETPPLYEPQDFGRDNLNHPIRVPDTKYQQRGGYYDYQTSASRDEEKQNTKGDEDDVRLSQSSEIVSKEKEILKNMHILDKLLSEDSSDIDDNVLGEKIMSEETKRVARAIRQQRPGFFWTLARVTFETFNDTRSALQQISEIINNSISPDSATQSSMPSGSLTAVSTPRNATSANGTESATTPSTTTTQAPFVLTRNSLQSLIRRNVLGLVKLFNLEWSDALNQSEVSVKEFQKNLNTQVGTFLQDNPNAY